MHDESSLLLNGLRDYGTGEWEGGDEGCEHEAGRKNHEHAGDVGPRNADGNAFRNSSRYVNQGDPTPNECGKCGARRVDRQIGLEDTPDQWVARLVDVFREVRRVLRDDGTLWVEIGDSYSSGGNGPGGTEKQASNVGALLPAKRAPEGYKPKDLLGQPWLLAFALRADGWYLRSEIIWSRPNPMPESVTDRPTKSHSTVFLLSKKPRYFFDADAIREPHQYDGRKKLTHDHAVNGSHDNYSNFGTDQARWPNPSGANARSVWNIPTQPTPFAHFATWPEKLVARMIAAGTSERGVCPECGAPWQRNVEKGESDYARIKRETGMSWKDMREAAVERGMGHDGPTREMIGGTRDENGNQFTYKAADRTLLGWQPSCAHDTPPVPAVVLDPFGGSGTTALVARKHGRRSILIELNADYCQLAADRLAQQSLLTELA